MRKTIRNDSELTVQNIPDKWTINHKEDMNKKNTCDKMEYKILAAKKSGKNTFL
jgi:hypothetical protein